MRSVVAGLVIALTTAGAQAGWQNTRWGMTVDEVDAAAGPLARRNVNAERSRLSTQPLVSAPYVGAGVNFTSNFYFEGPNQTLSWVDLTPNDLRDCPAVLTSLRTAYGAGQSETKGAIETHKWVDAAKSNTVSFSLIKTSGFFCTIFYKPYPEVAAPPQPKPAQGGL